MRVTKIEILHSTEPIPLPEPWHPAWQGPEAAALTAFDVRLYKVYTDEGIVGYGPYTGGDPALVQGVDPFHVGSFWETHMSGRRSGASGKGASGLEIALWDIVGKAAAQPLYRLLGACRDRIAVYAATSRLLTAEQHVRQVQELMALGFKAVKLRLHRPDPRDDLAVVSAVRRAAGDDLIILVDANQNNAASGYPFWSRRTAMQVARELDALDVYVLEEPLPRADVEGLAEIAASVDMFVAGGEHTPTVHDFRQHLLVGAYDVVQPDVTMGGNMGVIGIRKVATLADCLGRLVVPHVLSNAHLPLCLAPTLHAMASVPNCPLVEYPYDPPLLTAATTQTVIAEPMCIEADGCVRVPDRPGLGIEIDERQLRA